MASEAPSVFETMQTLANSPDVLSEPKLVLKADLIELKQHISKLDSVLKVFAAYTNKNSDTRLLIRDILPRLHLQLKKIIDPTLQIVNLYYTYNKERNYQHLNEVLLKIEQLINELKAFDNRITNTDSPLSFNINIPNSANDTFSQNYNFIGENNLYTIFTDFCKDIHSQIPTILNDIDRQIGLPIKKKK